MAVCRDCIIGDHRNHAFEDLGSAVGKMREDIKLATSATTSFFLKLESAGQVLMEKENDNQLSEEAIALKKEINTAARRFRDGLCE